MEPCQGEETSPNNVLPPTGVWTALGDSQEPALGPERAFSSCIHQLSCAKPEALQLPLSESLPTCTHAPHAQQSLCQCATGRQQHSGATGPDLGSSLV